MSNMLALEQPKLRFKKFGDVWNKNILNDICTKVKLKNKSNLHSIVLTNSAQYGVIKQTDFFDKDIADQNNLSGYFVVKKDDFVYNPRISELAPVGPLNRNNLETGVMSPLYTVFSFQKVRLDFIEYYFKASKWHKYMYLFSNVGARSDRMSISQSDFMNMPIFLPNMIEQQKIVSFLSSVDKKIELLTKKHELLEKYKKGLMQKLFAQEMRFKQDDGSDFPDWKIGILDNLIKKIADGGTPPTNDKSNFGGEINWVVIDDIQDKIEVTKIKLTEKGYKKCSSSLWEPEDIILSTGATIGEVGITKLTTATKQGICGIKVNKECCNIFLKEWFKSENARLQFKKYAQGSSIKEVRPPTLIKFKIIFPELAEQQKIASFLSALDKKLDLVKQQIEKTQTFKKGLLQQMFV